jgi:acetyl esterase
LAPEDPYPAGFDDCVTVTEWAVANAGRFGVPAGRVAVAGESAGGTLAAAVALSRRDRGESPLAGQILIYPGVGGSVEFPSDEEFDGLVLSLKAKRVYWAAYSAGRDLDDDPYAAPLSADSLAGLPPALVMLGGCDMLRDEGRAYAARLRTDGVAVEEVCYPGQPHGFVNHGFPASVLVYERIGDWWRQTVASGAGS